MIGIGDQLVADMVLVDGYPHVVQGSQSGPFEYTWFDGLTWRSQRIGDERLHAVQAVRVGATLHVAALLSDATAAPQLHYLALPLRSALPLRRDVIAMAPRPTFQLSLNASGNAPQLIYQRADRSAWWVTGLGGVPNQTRNFDLDGFSQMELMDMVGGRGLLWLVYQIYDQGLSEPRLRVRGYSPDGASFEEALDAVPLNFSNRSHVARIALSNDASPLVALAQQSSSNGISNHHFWLRRSGSGQWICPLGDAEDCRLTPSNTDGEARRIFTRSLSIANDTGGGYIAVTVQRPINSDESASLWIRRIYQDGSTTDTPRADNTGLDAPAVASLPPAFDFVLFSSRQITIRDGERAPANLYAGLAGNQPWRRYDTPGNTIQAALSMALDPVGEPVALADGGSAYGLMRSRWNAQTNAIERALLRPRDERYTHAAHAFADDGRLHALAIAASGSVYHLVASQSDAQATRELLAAAGADPELAIDDDGLVFALWYDPTVSGIRLAQRRPYAEGWSVTTLPGSHSPSSRPQLALSRTGFVFVSAHDSTDRRIRVWRRETGDVGAAFMPVMETLPIVAQAAHDLAGTRDGRPVLAYVRADVDAPQFVAYRFPASTYLADNQIVDVSIPNDIPVHQPVVEIKLDLVDGSPSDARIVFAHANATAPGFSVVFGRRTAISPETPFEPTPLGNLTAADRAIGLALVAGSTSTYVAAAELGNLTVLRHTDSGRSDGHPRPDRLAPIVQEAPLPDAGGARVAEDRYWLDLCFCLLGPCIQARSTVKQSLPIELSAALRQRFSTTEQGRHYLTLWAQHGAELGALVMQDPTFAARRGATYALFGPGLRAFVEGRGDDARMSAGMLEHAAAIWHHFADNGSPALRAAIDTELERTHDLQLFAGMSFEQWFAALPGQPPLFVDGFE